MLNGITKRLCSLPFAFAVSVAVLGCAGPKPQRLTFQMVNDSTHQPVAGAMAHLIGPAGIHSAFTGASAEDPEEHDTRITNDNGKVTFPRVYPDDVIEMDFHGGQVTWRHDNTLIYQNNSLDGFTRSEPIPAKRKDNEIVVPVPVQ